MPPRLKPRAGITRRSAAEREELARTQTAEAARRRRQDEEEAAIEAANQKSRYGIGMGQTPDRLRVGSNVHSRPGGGRIANAYPVAHPRGPPEAPGQEGESRALRRGRGGFMGQSDREREREQRERERERTKAFVVGGELERGFGGAEREDEDGQPESSAARSSVRAGEHGTYAQGIRTGKRGKQDKAPGPIKYDEDGDIAMLGLPPQARIKPEDPDDHFSEDSEEGKYGNPIDIDKLDEESDLENDHHSPDDASPDNTRSKSASIRPNRRPVPANLFPVRLKRQEHIDRKIGLNTESSAATAVGAKKTTSTDKSDDVVISSGDEAIVTESRNTDTTIPTSRKLKAEPNSPDHGDSSINDRMDIRLPSRPQSTEPAPDSETAPAPAARPHTRKQIYQTDEERQEDAIYEANTLALLRELDQQARAGAGVDTADDDTHMANGDVDLARHEINRDSNSYLFQLPPIMPDLVLASSQLKIEDQSDSDLSMDDAEALPAADSDPKNTTTNGTTPSIPIKIEEDAPVPSSTTKPPPKAQQPNQHKPALSPGHVGKLRVHASGRTTLDWGTEPMELGMGMNVEFLQAAVWTSMVPVLGQDGKATGRSEGEAVGLGAIRGKFVVTPDWDEIFD